MYDAGAAVGLSSDSEWLAIGGPQDSNNKGATWIFRRDPITRSYRVHGKKLIGSGCDESCEQGKRGT